MRLTSLVIQKWKAVNEKFLKIFPQKKQETETDPLLCSINNQIKLLKRECHDLIVINDFKLVALLHETADIGQVRG